PDRQRARGLRTSGHRPLLRRGGVIAGAVGVRPHRRRRTDHRPVPDGVVVGGRIVAHHPGLDAAGGLPHRTRPLVPRGGDDTAFPVLRHPTAKGHVPPEPRLEQLACGPAHGVARPRPRRLLDRDWLARHHGGSRAKWTPSRRPRSRSAGWRCEVMTAILPSEVSATQQLVQPALREAVTTLTPTMRRIVSYHFGWTDEHGEVVNGGRGKALRPALALLAARAAGAPPESALPGAVAVGLVHDLSWLHDDVMAGDTERRHRPTAWRLFGTPAAILAGDALLTLAMEVLDSVGERSANQRLAAAVHRLIEGQSADIEYESRTIVSVEE